MTLDLAQRSKWWNKNVYFVKKLKKITISVSKLLQTILKHMILVQKLMLFNVVNFIYHFLSNSNNSISFYPRIIINLWISTELQNESFLNKNSTRCDKNWRSNSENKKVYFIVRLGVSGFPFLSVPFPRNAKPFQNLFLSIFKHNWMFTYPITVFSQKVDMGSGFSGTETRNWHPYLRYPQDYLL